MDRKVSDSYALELYNADEFESSDGEPAQGQGMSDTVVLEVPLDLHEESVAVPSIRHTPSHSTDASEPAIFAQRELDCYDKARTPSNASSDHIDCNWKRIQSFNEAGAVTVLSMAPSTVILALGIVLGDFPDR